LTHQIKGTTSFRLPINLTENQSRSDRAWQVAVIDLCGKFSVCSWYLCLVAREPSGTYFNPLIAATQVPERAPR
jgi:hypothetical protein